MKSVNWFRVAAAAALTLLAFAGAWPASGVCMGVDWPLEVVKAREVASRPCEWRTFEDGTGAYAVILADRTWAQCLPQEPGDRS